MQQRLALAQALLNKPDFFVLDEPTVGLDPQEMREIRELIRNVAAGGATVLLSSHILAEVEQVCTHAAVMSAGKLVAEGTVSELMRATSTAYLEVDDVDRALAVLSKLENVTAEREGKGLAVSLDGLERSRLVAALVGAGVGVETIAPRHQLEDAYFEIIGGATDDSR
jgi:ABC-2 type transport system ATP-binding protein